LQRAALLADFPDLAGLKNDAELAGALQVMAAQNPQRHAAFAQRVTALQQVGQSARTSQATVPEMG